MLTYPLPYPEEKEAWRPPDNMPIWEHGEKYCTLPDDSAIKGMWSMDKVPALKIFLQWMDPNDPTYQITICKDSQSGVTLGFQLCVGYYIHQHKATCMHVLADEETSEEIGYSRYRAMFDGHETFVQLKDINNWKKTKMGFVNGGIAEIVWASSVAKLASKSRRIIGKDEIDKPAWYLMTREGSTLLLPDARAKTYRDIGLAKIVQWSTPTDPDGHVTQAILRHKAKDNQERHAVWDHHCMCPHCQTLQPMNFWYDQKKNFWFPDGIYRGVDNRMHNLGRLVWEGGRDATDGQIAETARYECGECGYQWTELERLEAIDSGQAVPRGSEVTGMELNKGLCLTGLVSKLTSMKAIVADWCNACRQPGKMKQDKAIQFFVNDIIGEPHKKVVIETTELSIFMASVPDLPEQTLPEEAIALTCGIDPGGHIFHLAVWAWLADYTSYMIHAEKLTEWAHIKEFLFDSTYGGLSIWRAGIDTGGTKVETSDMSMYEEAVRFICANKVGKNGCKVWGTKGSSQPMGQRVKLGNRMERFASGKPIPGGIQLVMIDTDKMKDLFFGVRLANAMKREGEERAYLHAMDQGNDMHRLFAYHLTGEQKEIDPRKGTESWVEKHANHWLDSSIIAHAAADMQWPGGGVHRLGGQMKRSPRMTGDNQTSAQQAQGVRQHSPTSALRGRTINPNYGRRLV